MRLRFCPRAGGAALLCGVLALQPHSPAHASSDAGTPRWLRVDPTAPSTLYLGLPGPFLERSTDGGSTWQILSDGAILGDYAAQCGDSAAPPLIARGSHDLYVTYSVSTDAACRSSAGGLLRSRDGAQSFAPVSQDTVVSLASPPLSGRLYAILTKPAGSYLDQSLQPNCSGQVSVFDPVQGSWRAAGTLPGGGADNPLNLGKFCPDLIDDPWHPSVLYANTRPPSRSTDGGRTWTAMIPPAVGPVPAAFALRADPSLDGAQLEGLTSAPGAPADRRFYSADQGATWSVGSCPGDHAGVCPTIVLRNVFGAGAEYAVFPDGIYPFQGTGPAGASLPPGTGWPFTLDMVADMQGGRQMGDPVYALLRNGALYRSPDAGHTWQPLTGAALPTARPRSFPAGSLPAGPYGHAVGRRFVATYRRLGTLIVGYPVDEPYSLRGVVVQDFEHLQLQWRAGAVAVGDLGSEADPFLVTLCDGDPMAGWPCVNGPHTNDGIPSQDQVADFARFVARHGGDGGLRHAAHAGLSRRQRRRERPHVLHAAVHQGPAGVAPGK